MLISSQSHVLVANGLIQTMQRTSTISRQKCQFTSKITPFYKVACHRHPIFNGVIKMCFEKKAFVFQLSCLAVLKKPFALEWLCKLQKEKNSHKCYRSRGQR